MLPLIPQEASSRQSGGLTTSARPDFWFFVPHTAKDLDSLIFSLSRSSDYELVYEVELEFPEQPGLVQIKFPVGAPALETGVDYSWVIEAKVNCPPPPENPEGEVLTSTTGKPPLISIDQMQGWIERYQPDAELNQMLKTMPQQQAYRDAGIWFDALNLLAAQRQTQPDTPQWRQAWSKLLEVYGLEGLSNKAFADCCGYSKPPTVSDEKQ